MNKEKRNNAPGNKMTAKPFHIALKTFILCFILLTILSQTSVWNTARINASEKVRYMYASKPAVSYFYTKEDPPAVAYYYGEGEKVKVYGTYTYKNKRYYHVKDFGLDTCIPERYLTKEKPKYSYKVNTNYEMIELKAKVNLYQKPTKSSKSIKYDKKNLYTLGDTNRWYKVFVNGKVYFLAKNNPNIDCVSPAKYPYFQTRGIEEKKVKNITKRFYYAFAMLPYEAREHLREAKYKIIICSHFLDAEYEAKGFAGGTGYEPNGIELKEGDIPYRFEHSFFHEVGHALSHDYRYAGKKERAEGDDLNLVSYYKDSYREYSAEAFDYYVRNKKYLKTNAPLTYKYVERMLAECLDSVDNQG